MEKWNLTKEEYVQMMKKKGDFESDKMLEKYAVKIPYFWEENGMLTFRNDCGANFLFLKDGVFYIPSTLSMNYYRQMMEFTEKDYNVLYHVKRKIEARLAFIEKLEKSVGNNSINDFKEMRYTVLEEIKVSNLRYSHFLHGKKEWKQAAIVSLSDGYALLSLDDVEKIKKSTFAKKGMTEEIKGIKEEYENHLEILELLNKKIRIRKIVNR